MTETSEKSPATDKDQRLQVLIYLAIFICFIHFFQENRRQKTEKPDQDIFAWISTPVSSGLYLLPKGKFNQNDLFAAHQKPGEKNSEEDLVINLDARKSYQIFENKLPTLRESDDNPKAAPFFYKKISINRAEQEILTTIPGVGETLARKIIDLRNERGLIKSLNELLQIDGIGKKKLAVIIKHLTL